MTIYILTGVIILQFTLHYFERKDLYNRIMSKDYHEYKGEKQQAIISAHRKRLSEWRKKDGDSE